MSPATREAQTMATNAIAASGNMIQHYSTIFARLSENIANANTTGFRANNAVFTASLASTTGSAHEPDLVSMGPFKNTGNDLDVAIRRPNSMLALGGVMNSPKQAEKGQHFTRDGSLQAFQAADDPDQFMLVHGASNRLVLGHALGLENPALENAEPIRVPRTFLDNGNPRPLSRISINAEGIVEATYAAATNTESPVIRQIARLAVTGLQGHQVEGRSNNNVYKLRVDAFGDTNIIRSDSLITPRHLEGSNIKMQEMFAAMITMQRNYQSATKALTTSDEMLSVIRDLKR